MGLLPYKWLANEIMRRMGPTLAIANHCLTEEWDPLWGRPIGLGAPRHRGRSPTDGPPPFSEHDRVLPPHLTPHLLHPHPTAPQHDPTETPPARIPPAPP